MPREMKIKYTAFNSSFLTSTQLSDITLPGPISEILSRYFFVRSIKRAMRVMEESKLSVAAFMVTRLSRLGPPLTNLEKCLLYGSQLYHGLLKIYAKRLGLRKDMDQAVGQICADNEVSEGVSEPHHTVVSARHGGEQVVKDR